MDFNQRLHRLEVRQWRIQKLLEEADEWSSFRKLGPLTIYAPGYTKDFLKWIVELARPKDDKLSSALMTFGIIKTVAPVIQTAKFYLLAADAIVGAVDTARHLVHAAPDGAYLPPGMRGKLLGELDGLAREIREVQSAATAQEQLEQAAGAAQGRLHDLAARQESRAHDEFGEDWSQPKPPPPLSQEEIARNAEAAAAQLSQAQDSFGAGFCEPAHGAAALDLHQVARAAQDLAAQMTYGGNEYRPRQSIPQTAEREGATEPQPEGADDGRCTTAPRRFHWEPPTLGRSTPVGQTGSTPMSQTGSTQWSGVGGALEQREPDEQVEAEAGTADAAKPWLRMAAHECGLGAMQTLARGAAQQTYESAAMASIRNAVDQLQPTLGAGGLPQAAQQSPQLFDQLRMAAQTGIQSASFDAHRLARDAITSSNAQTQAAAQNWVQAAAASLGERDLDDDVPGATPTLAAQETHWLAQNACGAAASLGVQQAADWANDQAGNWVQQAIQNQLQSPGGPGGFGRG